jgi:putative ABC transport system substrate-binding protein
MFYKRVYWLIVLVLLATLVAGCGDNKKDDAETKMVKVGILNPIPVFDPAVDGFKERMAELGYIEGKNVTYLYNGAVGSTDVPALAEEAKKLVDGGADILMVGATPGALAAQQVTSTVPIVFSIVTDPVGAGLVKELIKPGTNLTGLSDARAEVKRLDYLTTIDPTIKKVYVPYDANNPAAVTALGWTQEAADALNVELVTPVVSTPDDVQQAIANMPDDVDAVFILPDMLLLRDEFTPLWGEISQARQLPVVYPTGGGTGVAVMTYGVDVFLSGRQTADMVVEILRGATVSETPVRQLEFSLTVDLVAAKRYGIEIPDDLVRFANTVIRE